MSKLDILKTELNKLVDPTLNKTFEAAGSILGIQIDDAGVLDLAIQLKNRRKDETNVKLEIAR